VRKDVITFKVDTQKLNARIALLKEQLLIAKNLGPKPAPQDLEKWLTTLNQELGGRKVSYCMNVSKGFIFLRGEDSNAIHSTLCCHLSNQSGDLHPTKLGTGIQSGQPQQSCIPHMGGITETAIRAS
jgi:hypothetical protein